MKKDITFFSALAEYRNSRINKKNFSDSLSEMDQNTRRNLLNCRISPYGELILPSNLLFPEKRGAILAASIAATDVMGYEPALQAKSVLVSLGAKLITGLTADLMIPKSSEISSAWEGEIDENIDGGPTLDSVTVKPIRISSSVLISNVVLTQTRIDHTLEIALEADIIKDMLSKVELAAINGSGTGEPTGILNTTGIGSVAGGDNGAIPTEDHLIDLEKAVADEHADQGYLAFLTNPKVRRQLRKTPLDVGAGLRVWDLNGSNPATSGSIGNLMGYPAGVTANVPSDLTKGEGSSLSAIIFGDWSKLWLAQWNGFSVLLNPYTQSHYNYSIFTIDSWWNVVVKQPKAFAAMTDVITED